MLELGTSYLESMRQTHADQLAIALFTIFSLQEGELDRDSEGGCDIYSFSDCSYGTARTSASHAGEAGASDNETGRGSAAQVDRGTSAKRPAPQTTTGDAPRKAARTVSPAVSDMITVLSQIMLSVST